MAPRHTAGRASVKPCPNMRVKSAGRACPKFEQDSPFDVDVTCCRKTPPKPLDTYKACPSPMSEIKTKTDCNAYAVHSRVVRSKKLCCRKTKPRDSAQKVLNTVKVARHLRHQKKSRSKRSVSDGSSIDTPHVSEDSAPASHQGAASPKSGSSDMPSHVSTPRGSSSPKVRSNSQPSGRESHSRSASKDSEKEKPTRSVDARHAIRSPRKQRSIMAMKKVTALALAAAALRSNKAKSVGSHDQNVDEMVALLGKLKVAEPQKSDKSAKKSSSRKVVEAREAMPLSDYNHFMELLSQIVDNEDPSLVNEDRVMNIVDSPNGLSPAEYDHFLELYKDFEDEQAKVEQGKQLAQADSPNGLSPEQYAHFLELYNNFEAAPEGQDMEGHVSNKSDTQDDDPADDGQLYDTAVNFKPFVQFNAQQYLKKHQQDVKRLQSQIDGSRENSWYINRTKPQWYIDHSRPSDTVARTEVAALLDIILDMEGGQLGGAGKTRSSMASRLLKLYGMPVLPNSKVPKTYFNYQNLRLPRVRKYMDTVFNLAGINSAADAVKVWREVRANPEDRLMSYFMVPLIEYVILRQHNDIMGKKMALGDVL